MPAPRRNRSPLSILWVTVFVDLVGFSLVLPLLPQYSERFGASDVQIGLLVATFSAAQFLFAPLWGAMSDRRGRRPVIVLSLAGTAVGSLLFGLAHTLWLLFLARALDGISGASVSVAQAYVSDVTAPAERSKALGMLGMAFGLGFVVGPALGGFLAHWDLRLPFFAAAAIAAVNAVAAWFRLPEPPKRSSANPRGSRRFAALRAVRSNRPLGALLAVSLLYLLAFVAMEATFSLFGQRRFGFTPSQNAAAFVYIGVLIVAVQGGLMRRLGGRVSDRVLFVTGLVCTAVALFRLGHVHALWELAAVLAGLALGAGLVNPTLTALVTSAVDTAHRGAALGTAQSLGAAARMAGPPLATAGFQHTGFAPTYTAAAAVALGCVLIGAAGARRLPVRAGETPPGRYS